MENYCLRHGIKCIDILKTDTEGYELQVLRGAKSLFERHAIRAVLVEAGIRLSDVIPNHVPLAKLDAMLSPYGISFRGIYDVAYNSPNYETTYANALFKLHSLVGARIRISWFHRMRAGCVAEL